MADPRPVFDQLNIVSGDVEASIAFYRRLGVAIPENNVWRTSTGPHHVSAQREQSGSDAVLDIDSAAFARVWNASWRRESALAGRVVVGFSVGAREDVDRLYAQMTAAGYRGLITERAGRTRAYTADLIVNCTGPEECYRRLADPLVRHLFATERARPGAMELGLDVDDCGRLLDRTGRPQGGLYVLGPPTRGRFWEITAVPWIRAHAVRIADHIAEIEAARTSLTVAANATTGGMTAGHQI